MHPSHYIYGIDFIGAQDTGKKIWIAEGVVKTDSLLIADCFRARDLQDSGNDKDFIKENQDAAFGLNGIGVRPTQLTIKQSALQKFRPNYDLFQNLYEC